MPSPTLIIEAVVHDTRTLAHERGLLAVECVSDRKEKPALTCAVDLNARVSTVEAQHHEVRANDILAHWNSRLVVEMLGLGGDPVAHVNRCAGLPAHNQERSH
jgi:hypothetical protein